MPIHKKLDGLEFNSALKNKQLTIDTYNIWLLTTYQIHHAFNEILNKSNLQDIPLLNLMPAQLGIPQLIADIDQLKLPNKNKTNFSVEPHKHDDELIVILYTVCGSMLGSKMIKRYIQTHLLNAPIRYLDFISTNSSNWDDVKDFINNVEISISEKQLSEYTISIWSSVYEIYSKNFPNSN